MFRGKTPVEFESTLERDFLIRQEFSLTVLGVIPQPCQIQYLDPATGRHYCYTPDFLVNYKVGSKNSDGCPRPILVEVKPEGEWRKNWRKWLPKWKAAYRYAKNQGWVFHIYDETRLRDQTLRNIKFLSRYKRRIFPSAESLVILETVRKMGATTVGYLLARHFMGAGRSDGLSHIWHLLAGRKLDCDISGPLDEFTEIWILGHE